MQLLFERIIYLFSFFYFIVANKNAYTVSIETGKKCPSQHIFFRLVDLLDFFFIGVLLDLYWGFPPFGLFCIFTFGSHQDHDGISTSLQSPSEMLLNAVLCVQHHGCP